MPQEQQREGIKGYPPSEKWQGDLEDDCFLEIGPWLAHAELMVDDVICSQKDEIDDEPERWQEQIWFCSVGRATGRKNENGIEIYEEFFYSGYPKGSITSGEMARYICECVLRAALTSSESTKPTQAASKPLGEGDAS